MKVLWLTQSPSGASIVENNLDPGRGWISSLEDLIATEKEITLGVCFFSQREEFKFNIGNVTYYPVKNKYHTLFGKIYQRITISLGDSNTPDILKVVNDFKPDIIHLFGSESGMTEIIWNTNIPIILHLQGLITLYLKDWFPLGINQRNIFLNSSARSNLFRRGYYFEYKLFKKRAKREIQAIKLSKYFFGRTAWDKEFALKYSTDANYFHCDEVLRPIFYKNSWEFTKNDFITIVSVINPQLYKGLDIVFQVAQMLVENNIFEFKWKIIGISPDSDLVKLMEKIYKKTFKTYLVEFKGPLSGNVLLGELTNSSLFIHPSHIDNSPNSVCEAMLLGMPVVAGNVGGLSSLITDGYDGLLYDSYKAKELYNIIISLKNDESKLKYLSQNAKFTASKRNNKTEILKCINQAYNEIVTKRMPQN
jgi:glycosyltransferase involved in cell wall biosynthesis